MTSKCALCLVSCLAAFLLPGCGGSSGTVAAEDSIAVNAVTVTPTEATVAGRRFQTFSAKVEGVSDLSVTWTVQEGAEGGTITDAGEYKAPAFAGTFHVIAVSKTDSRKRGTATVIVIPAGIAH